ncbi:uncharacterized protein PRD47_013721 isoform 1-T1 [Ara ararauna]
MAPRGTGRSGPRSATLRRRRRWQRCSCLSSLHRRRSPEPLPSGSVLAERHRKSVPEGSPRAAERVWNLISALSNSSALPVVGLVTSRQFVPHYGRSKGFSEKILSSDRGSFWEDMFVKGLQHTQIMSQ